MQDEVVLLCIDMGTTRTRAWLLQGKTIRAHADSNIGVRDVASGKTPAWLLGQLVQLLNHTLEQAEHLTPVAVVAAGMITSEQGLRNVPHVQAPASVKDLAAHIHFDKISLPENLILPMLLIPGVRTGEKTNLRNAALEADLMRGEETLCIGLMEEGLLRKDASLLNLGSHWKYIEIDNQDRILRSRTTLTGELIHVTQTHTLLAASLPQAPPQTLHEDWVDAGFNEAKRSGLGRALFCVRLLQINEQGSMEQRLSFLYGAFLHEELTTLLAITSATGKQSPTLVLAGPRPLAETWSRYAKHAGLSVTILTDDQRQHAYLHGLAILFALANTAQ